MTCTKRLPGALPPSAEELRRVRCRELVGPSHVDRPSAAILPPMSMDRQLLAAIRSVLERHPEVRLAFLFGSRARGVAGPEADLDLAIEGFQGQALDRLRLMAELHSATGFDTDLVDISRGQSIGYPLLNALNRDGIAIYEAERHAEAEFRTRALLQLSLDRPWYERMRNAYLDHLATERAGGADG